MKEGNLFCFVLQLWDPSNWDALDRVVGIFGKLSAKRGAWAWYHDIWTCNAKVFEYWMIFSLKNKLNHSWKLVERSWWIGFNGICLVRFGFKMWEIMIFKQFMLLKIHKFQKTKFWKEKSLEDVVTLGPMAQATLLNIISMVELDPRTFDRS